MRKCITHILLIAIFLSFMQISVSAQVLIPETEMSANSGQPELVPDEASEQAASESEFGLAIHDETQLSETEPWPGETDMAPTSDTGFSENEGTRNEETAPGETDESPSEMEPTVSSEIETTEPSVEETILPQETETSEDPSESELIDPDRALPESTEAGEERESSPDLSDGQEKRDGTANDPNKMMRSNTYSYQIIPLVENIGYLVYVKTNDPDPYSFRFIDKDSIYGQDSLYQLKEHLFVDVQYENKSVYRVSGGYIFEYENSMPDGGKLTLQKKNGAGAFVDTNQTVTVPRLVNYIDYLLDTYTDSSMSGYEKLDAVQNALDRLAVYPNEFHDKSQSTGRYPFLLASGYKEIGIMQEYNYLYKTAANHNFAYYIYPYILDSSSFPGTMISVARKINPAAEYELTDYHWLVKIKLSPADEGKIYGGAGEGENNSVDVSYLAATFNFSKTESALKNDFSLEKLYSNLRSIKQRADQDVAQYEDILSGDTFKATVGTSSWIVLNMDGAWIVDGLPQYSTGLAYAHKAYGQSYHYASDAWVDGHYVNAWECLELGATFAEYPNADIIVQDMEYTDINGKYHKNDVVFSYEQKTDTWRAPNYYNNAGWYNVNMVLPEEFILTRAEVLAMNPDRNSNRIPVQGLYYDYTHKPGTPFTRVPVTGIKLTNNEITVQRDNDECEIPLTVVPADASEKRITFSSDNADIAYAAYDVQLDKCIVVGVETGETYITAKTMDGAYSIRIKVKVVDDRDCYYVKHTESVYRGTWGYEQVDTKYTGECLWGKIKDGYLVFEENDQSYRIDQEAVTLTPMTGTAYANGQINIRNAATGNIIASTKIGQEIRGIQKADGYIYFEYSGQKAKIWAAYLTYAEPADFYVKGGSNIRNQNFSIVARKYRGDCIRGIPLEGTEYIRFYENRSVRLIHHSLVSTDPIEITGYVNGKVNVRDAYSNNILSQYQLGDEVTGLARGDGYIYFYYGRYKVWGDYVTRKADQYYYVRAGSNIRDRYLGIIDYKGRGELICGTRLGDSGYIRFEENGLVRLIHQSQVTTSPVVRTAYAEGTVNVRSTSTGEIIGKLSKGNMVKGIQKPDGYIYITYKNQSAKVWAEYIGPLEVTGYVNGTTNVRYASDNEILYQYRIGDEVTGIKKDDGYIYFDYFYKIWADNVTTKEDQNYYVEGGSNIRNQALQIIDTKSRGELIRGTRLKNTNYIRFEENGSVRLIHQSVVTTSPVIRTGYAKGTVNVRSASTGEVIGKLSKGNTVKGIQKPDGYIYITYKNQSAKLWAEYVSSVR